MPSRARTPASESSAAEGSYLRPDVSILVTSWNTRDLTLACLDYIPDGAGKGSPLKYEVIIIDNGSRDGSAEALAARGDIELKANTENVGYAAAVNQAYAASCGELVLLLNSDIRFQPGALARLVEFLRQHEDAAGVAPLYINPDGSPQQHHFRLPTYAVLLANASAAFHLLPPVARRVRAYRMLDEDFSRPRPVQQPSASCLLLRRTALPADSLMDERYPVYFNDVALARTLSEADEKLWITPDAVVFHEHGASTRLLGGRLRRQYIGALVRYIGESEPRYRLILFRAVVFAQGLATRLLRRPWALPPLELWRAVCGDPGSLPDAPSRADTLGASESDPIRSPKRTSLCKSTQSQPRLSRAEAGSDDGSQRELRTT